MPNDTVIKTQMVFAGVNPVMAPDKLPDDIVQSALNIDFGAEPGAARVRRGSEYFGTIGGTATEILNLYHRHVAAATDSPYYAHDNTGGVWRLMEGTGTTTLGAPNLTATQIVASGNTEICPIGAFQAYTFISTPNSTNANMVKDDGTLTTDWLKQVPPAIATYTINTHGGLAFIGTCTVAEGTGTNGTGTCTAVSTDTVGVRRIQITGTCTTTNLNTVGGYAIDDYGVHYVDLYINRPSVVSKVHLDYSAGDATFANYWHAEMDTEVVENAQPDAAVLISDETGTGTGTVPPDIDLRELMLQAVRESLRPPTMRLTAASNTWGSWAVPRTNFTFVGKASAPVGWNNIGAVRIIIEADDDITVVVRDFLIKGDTVHTLNDLDVGYAYWRTWASTDTYGNIIGESNPSLVSPRIKCQQSNIIVDLAVGTNTATGSHGISHQILYRQGGFLQDAYAVATLTYNYTSTHTTSGTATADNWYTDYLSDIKVLANNNRMVRNIYTGNQMGNVVTIAEPYYNRLWVGRLNKVNWSLPGKPDTFPYTNELDVSHAGDGVTQLIVGQNSLVIVNWDSVYELFGNQFEGKNANFVLQRSGCNHGSKARKTCIKTPYGILLVDYDGLYLYQPGSGTEQPIAWAMAVLADAFKGMGTDDPATLKGDRLPGINKDYLQYASAAFGENKLYIAVPTTDEKTRPNTLLVLDFSTQKVWWYSYPFDITSLIWDIANSKLMAGTSIGWILLLESGQKDINAAGNATQGISWSFYTREWTTPSDTVLENVQLQAIGNPVNVYLYTDTSSSAVDLGTYTSTTKQWLDLPMKAKVGHGARFAFTGLATNQTAVYGLQWDSLTEPPQVQYWRTPHTTTEGEQLWTIAYHDIDIVNSNYTVTTTGSTTNTATGTATVTAVTYIDNSAVATHSLTSTVGGASGRKVWSIAFPAETYGVVAYTTYTCSSTGTTTTSSTSTTTGTATITTTISKLEPRFKLWGGRREGQPEPPRINYFKTPPQSIEEALVDGVDWDINPNGTVTSTVYLDNNALGTYTSTGTVRQSYTNSVPINTYGRTIWVVHNGSAFKHYNTWFHTRPEPDRWTTYVTPKDSGEEAIWDTVAYDMDPLGGTTTGIVKLDGTTLGTITCSGTGGRQSGVIALPVNTYGRTAWVEYTALTTNKFKHYQTWFGKRQEPSRLASWVTVKDSGEEAIWEAVGYDIDPLSGTSTGVVKIDGTAVTTFTMTGSLRQSGVVTLGADVYGRTGWVEYAATSTHKFKHYQTWFTKRPEPAKLGTYVTPREEGEYGQWDAFDVDLNPQAGTVTAIAYVDNTAVLTASLTGSVRTSLTNTIPKNTYGRSVYVKYTGSVPFKHYRTWWHGRPEPDSWASFVTTKDSGEERRLEGVDCDLNCQGGTISGVVYLDNTVLSTLTFTGTARQSYTNSLPAYTYGRTMWVEYTPVGTSSATGRFQHYNTIFHAQAEPDRWKTFTTPILSERESKLNAVGVDINCLGGTVTATVIVDGSGVSTSSLDLGVLRASSILTVPAETYGRIKWVEFNYDGTNRFKHYNTWLDETPEPSRLTYFATPRETSEEVIIDAVDYEINPLGGTTTACVWVDGTCWAIGTATGTQRVADAITLPADTYGRVRWVTYNSPTAFKVYNTWWHIRQEPDRVQIYATPRQSAEEQRWDAIDTDIDVLGQTGTGTAYVDGTAISTFTMTGSGRQSYTHALPPETYGRTTTVRYTSQLGRFKHYNTWWHGTPEPDRLATVQYGPVMKPSNQALNTWLVDMNPLGTVIGTLWVDDTVLMTQTFTGTNRHMFTVGQDVATDAYLTDLTGQKLYVVYNAVGAGMVMKHYHTQFVTEPQPFGKCTWMINYTKLGGATQMDMARFWALDAEPSTGTATITSIWDLDGTAYMTNTLTFSGREYRDRMPFTPGARYYLIQQRLLSNVPIKVWKVTVDIERLGVKGFSRTQVDGIPKGDAA